MSSVGGVIVRLSFQIMLFHLCLSDTMPLRESGQLVVCLHYPGKN